MFGPAGRLPARWSSKLGDQPSGPIQVHQSEQAEQVLLVLEQSPIPHLAIAELAFENPERMLDRGTDAGQQAIDALLLGRGVAARLALERHIPLRTHIILVVRMVELAALIRLAPGDTPRRPLLTHE